MTEVMYTYIFNNLILSSHVHLIKIPIKLINMCKTCVQKTRSVVRIEGTLSSFFENKTGLK